LKEGGALLCGLDEAGRGPLAGPVCAAAVILPIGFPLSVLNDSKKLNAGERERAKLAICESDAEWGIGWASAAEIDEINIHKASLLAMKRAFEAMVKNGRNLNIRAVVDGLFVPDINVPCEALVKADSSVPEVMAASILAKTARDRLMEYYGLFYPQYGYTQHKGYPTKAHREAIMRFGPSPIQRMSFSVKL
jgi:ribonuclease HII